MEYYLRAKLLMVWMGTDHSRSLPLLVHGKVVFGFCVGMEDLENTVQERYVGGYAWLW